MIGLDLKDVNVQKGKVARVAEKDLILRNYQYKL